MAILVVLVVLDVVLVLVVMVVVLVVMVLVLVLVHNFLNNPTVFVLLSLEHIYLSWNHSHKTVRYKKLLANL